MTDRELLEMAAKAAGIVGRYVEDACRYDDYGKYSHQFTGMELDDGDGDDWNPLSDDGDALRLAIKLRERRFVEINLLVGFVSVDLDNGDWFREDYNDDPCAATRRAIVRAAAAMAMQPSPA